MTKQKQLLLDSGKLRNRLKLRSIASERKLLESHASAREFFEKVGEHATKFLSSGALISTLLISSPSLTPASNKHLLPITIDNSNLSQSLKNILPPVDNWDLNLDQENKIKNKLKEIYGINATPELDGNRLPNSYGRMGAEQHLARFPGDWVENMAPGLGGWGYVNDPEVEKYYVAAQTLYIPDWKDRLEYYVKWYQFRHVVVVNPENGKAIIAAIADAGPAKFTGKHFGGSPEVMEYLNINTGMQNHPVIFFFLDDPNKEIPLGPLEYNVTNKKEILANQA